MQAVAEEIEHRECRLPDIRAVRVKEEVVFETDVNGVFALAHLHRFAQPVFLGVAFHIFIKLVEARGQLEVGPGHRIALRGGGFPHRVRQLIALVLKRINNDLHRLVARVGKRLDEVFPLLGVDG